MKKQPQKLITYKDFYSSNQWNKCRKIIFASNSKNCCKCGSSEELNIDHIEPKTKKPHLAFDLYNLQILCSKCNKEKYLDNNDYRDKDFIKSLEDYISEKGIKRKKIKYSLKIDRFVFEYPKGYKKKDKSLSGKKVKLKKRKPFVPSPKKKTRMADFKNPKLDINKILELQNQLK